LISKVAVLLSIGRNDASGRPQRADRDARALEMALGLVPCSQLHAVHAGNPNEAALQEYLGMGLDRLTVLATPAAADPVPALIAHLHELRPSLILAGTSSEHGEASGTVPYLVARALDLPLASAAAEAKIDALQAEILQVLPRGERRRLAAKLPAVVTIDKTAPDPRMSAFGRARRGQLDVIAGKATPDDDRSSWTAVPARRRPKRIKSVSGNAAERLRAVAETKGGQGEVLAWPSAQEAAQRILDFLLHEEIVRRKP
jgi:N,N-dimethylglycine/sarcosine catabolism electron transfer flavoprotein subunit beta